MSIAVQALPAMLSRLKLTALRDQLDSLLDEAARLELNLFRFLRHGRPPLNRGIGALELLLRFQCGVNIRLVEVHPIPRRRVDYYRE
jgi:hypothetical protein